MFFPNGGDVEAQDAILDPNRVEPFEATLRQYQPEVLVTCWSSPALREEWLEDLPSLRYICHTSGSVRRIIPRSFLENGGMVTNWGTLAARAVAEHALLLILAGLRGLPGWSAVITRKESWHPSAISTRTFFGKRLGIHGFGNVARALVDLCRPFGVSISAYTTGVSEATYHQLEVRPCSSLEDLFANADILVECEAFTPLTQGIVSNELLQQLPQGAFFVNVGRGAVVDEQALGKLAQEGRIQLALDVYIEEPLALTSPLHAVQGAILSPHIAGPTADQLPCCGALVQKNLQAFFNGQPLEALVSLQMYDYAT